jgi:hypothetical protein
MNQRRHRPAAVPSEGTSVVERILGAFLGAVSGAVLYIALQVVAFQPAHGARWSFDGPLKGYITAGAVLGLLFGFAFAKWLWSEVTDQLHFEASSWGFYLVAVAVFAGAIFMALKFANAA